MKINKFKKVGTNKYKIYFDNDILTVYEDVILKYNLLYKKDIDDDLLHEINKDNFKASIYDTAIKYISIRMRSVKELREYLTKKKFECKNIDEVIDRLLHENILNDSNFARCYVNDKLLLTNNRPDKIKSDLMRLGINDDIILHCSIVYSCSYNTHLHIKFLSSLSSKSAFGICDIISSFSRSIIISNKLSTLFSLLYILIAFLKCLSISCKSLILLT